MLELILSIPKNHMIFFGIIIWKCCLLYHASSRLIIYISEIFNLALSLMKRPGNKCFTWCPCERLTQEKPCVSLKTKTSLLGLTVRLITAWPVRSEVKAIVSLCLILWALRMIRPFPDFLAIYCLGFAVVSTLCVSQQLLVAY